MLHCSGQVDSEVDWNYGVLLRDENIKGTKIQN